MTAQRASGKLDALVAGGCAAGLSGALTLARARRSVLVVDSGEPRNAPAAAALGRLSCPAGLATRGRGSQRKWGLAGEPTGHQDDTCRVDLLPGKKILPEHGNLFGRGVDWRMTGPNPGPASPEGQAVARSEPLSSPPSGNPPPARRRLGSRRCGCRRTAGRQGRTHVGRLHTDRGR
ncbi:FAD-binding protein [Streptomyces cyaneochromogenes]|uniref:FAD-binding protein n=1 Tax=Streptomyces cyaneochromogenes TaxID=2496836 RepID=UPI003899CD7C